MSNVNNVELECKIPVPERAPLVRILQSLGAEDHGDVHEQNWVFDTPSQSLRDKEMLLRLRTVDTSEGAVVTVKAPTPEKRFKARKEYETRVDSLDAGRLIFEALGYQVVWFYEKRRHSWSWGGCEIVLDLLPEIGCFVEVEGADEGAIESVLNDLHLDSSAHVRENYRALFLKFCEAQGVGMHEMRFRDASC